MTGLAASSDEARASAPGTPGFGKPAHAPKPAWDDGYPIAPSLRYPAALVLIVANIMVVLDSTVANVSVPHIAGNLGATLEQGAWVITSYAVAEAVCVPLSGWLTQRFGQVRVFLSALGGFTLFSLLCGLSATLPMLVGMRIGQGLCGGLIMPLVQTLLARIFPGAQLTKVYTLWAMTVMVGPALGPVIGGFVSDNFSWHWIFLINIPIGIAALVFGYALLGPAESATRRLPIDGVGVGLLVVWVGALQLMLDNGRDRDWFHDQLIVALGAIAVLGLCAFVIWELTAEHPAVDLRIFRNTDFLLLTVAISLCYGSYVSGTVVLPLWLQSTMGYSASQAGLLLATGPLGTFLTMRLAVKLMLRIDPRVVVTLGAVCTASAFFLRLGWSTDVDPLNIAWLVLFQGMGIPMLIVTMNNLALNTVPDDMLAAGAGMTAFTRTMSIAIGTTLMLSLWSSQEAVTRSDMVGTLHPGSTMTVLANQGMNEGSAAAYVAQLIDRQANTIAMLDANMIAGIAVLAAASVIWLLPRIQWSRFKGGK